MRKVTSHAMLGAATGAAWYLWFDGVMCPHGTYTMNRYVLAHSIFAGVAGAAFFGPATFAHCFTIGTIFGSR